MSTLQNLTSAEAFMIGAAIRNCLLDAKREASICVVNKHGFVLFQINMDRPTSATSSIALHKAEQAAIVGRRTSWLRDEVAAGRTTAEIRGIDPKVFAAWAGGCPIIAKDGTILGGAGVSALAQEEDEMFCSLGILLCGFSSDRDQRAAGNPEGTLYAHHIGITVPTIEIATLVKDRLLRLGANVVKGDAATGKFFIRLNPFDVMLVEISAASNDDVYIHVDYAVADLAVANDAHEGGLADHEIPNMLFEMIGLQDLVGQFQLDIAFSKRD